MSQEPLDGFRKKMTATSAAPSPSKSPVTFDVSHAGPISLASTLSGGTVRAMVSLGDVGTGEGVDLAGAGDQAGSCPSATLVACAPSAFITSTVAGTSPPPWAKAIRLPSGDQLGDR